MPLGYSPSSYSDPLPEFQLTVFSGLHPMQWLGGRARRPSLHRRTYHTVTVLTTTRHIRLLVRVIT